MKTKTKRIFKIIAVVILAIALFCGIAAVVGLKRAKANRVGHYVYTDEKRTISGPETEGIGAVTVSTLPLEGDFGVRRATYSYSGRVLIGYLDGSDNVICSLNDDGTDMIEVFRGEISSSYRLLPFADNRRILMGDYILECPEGTTLDNCPKDSAIVVPITFPKEFSEDSAVTDTWTEVIIAQDNEHFAWTIRRSDCGAVNATAEASAYRSSPSMSIRRARLSRQSQRPKSAITPPSPRKLPITIRPSWANSPAPPTSQSRAAPAAKQQ